jgi:hypothetical protein
MLGRGQCWCASTHRGREKGRGAYFGEADMRASLAAPQGLDVVAFEQNASLGGLWRYSDAVLPGSASIYRSISINTSKETMAFSDFPIPLEWPQFLTHELVCEYLRLYAEKFGLLRHVRFGCRVNRVARAPLDSPPASRAWRVETASGADDFDAVLVANGHHWSVLLLPFAVRRPPPASPPFPSSPVALRARACSPPGCRCCPPLARSHPCRSFAAASSTATTTRSRWSLRASG